jgi:signal transduction histidine kinase
MIPEEKQKTIKKLPHLLSFATIFAVGLLGMMILDSWLLRAIALPILIIFSINFKIASESDDVSWKKHAYFAVQSILVCSLMVMHPSWSVFPILFFILSAHSMLAWDERTGYIWVGIFTVLTGLVFIIFEGTLEGVLSVLPFGAGYFFFAFFSTSFNEAEQARKESQALLLELREAHQRLQEYATQVEELAVAEERNRLAREMHDTLGHRLTVAAVTLEGAQRLISTEPERSIEMVSTVRDEVREALKELRRTVATLREPLQTDIPLNQSIPQMVESFQKATGIEVTVQMPDEVMPLPNTHRLVVYRAIQEFLTNVQRHAHAKGVEISLMYTDSGLTLHMRDDGVGFDPQLTGTGFGLRGLQERVSKLFGRMEIHSKPGEGTEIIVEIPINEELKHE